MFQQVSRFPAWHNHKDKTGHGKKTHNRISYSLALVSDFGIFSTWVDIRGMKRKLHSRYREQEQGCWRDVSTSCLCLAIRKVLLRCSKKRSTGSVLPCCSAHNVSAFQVVLEMSDIDFFFYPYSISKIREQLQLRLGKKLSLYHWTHWIFPFLKKSYFSYSFY